jgi:proprotein convertase subtilisin/kexin type 5
LCATCDLSCQACFLNSYNCTACTVSSSRPYLLVSNTSIGSCIAVCPFTYYADSSQGLCQTCSSLNIGCKNCSSTISCYNCDFGSGLVFYFGQCLSTTPVGYYNDSGNAKVCSSGCSSCTSLAICTSCISLSLSNSQCVATCPSQQVSVNKICTSCTFPCLTCFNIPTNCTSCNSTLSNQYFLSSGVCDKNCPIYTYPNPVGWVCSLCISPCETCTQFSSCSSCVNGYYLFNQTCKNTCPFGYVGLNRACTECTDSCLSCSGSTSNCLSCVSGTYLYNSSSSVCVSTCPFGLFPNNITQSCTGCLSPCKVCSNYATVCTSCNTGYLL